MCFIIIVLQCMNNTGPARERGDQGRIGGWKDPRLVLMLVCVGSDRWPVALMLVCVHTGNEVSKVITGLLYS